MPITKEGYDARRFPEIRESTRSGIESALGTPISSSPSTVIGGILSIFAGEITSQENLNLAGFNNLDIDKAEGVFLDKLVAYIGLKRLDASPASGQLKVWRDGVGEILSAVLFEDTNGRQFSAINGVNHTLEGCNEILITPASTLDSTKYAVVINGVEYAYTTTTGATKVEIITDIESQISSTTSLITSIEGDNLRIAAPDTEQNDLVVSYTRMQLLEIASFNFVESVLVGDLTVEENTITQVVTANPSLLRSNNPLPFTDGQDVETDEELRVRHQQSTQVASVATVPAITATLRNLPNVASASVVENRQIVPDSDGRPAKSYECIVEGGNPDEIADTIWETKPAGVELYGSISTVIIDFGGNQQVVEWSRPDPIYTHVRVTYSKYDEEQFPVNGESAIVDAALAYGDSLDLGNDVIPTRFIGGIYQNVDGISDLSIEVGTSASPSASEPDAWLTVPISIANNEFASFASGRVDVVEV